MSTTTTTPTISTRGDIDDILTVIEYFAEQMVEEARLDVSLGIGQVFEAHERAEELTAQVRALEALVMLPVDLYEEVWSALEAGEHLTDGLPDLPEKETIALIKVSQAARRALEQLSAYNIR
jgi:hypothetical protein